MAEYPAGTVTVHGVELDAFVDDAGQWITRVAGTPVTAPSKNALRAAAAPKLRYIRAKVRVPFLMQVRDEESKVTGAVRCTATGVHSGNGRVLARRDDTGQAVTLDVIHRTTCLDGGADPAEWARLTQASLDASRAAFTYEQAHKVDVRQAVLAALAEAAAAAAEQAAGE